MDRHLKVLMLGESLAKQGGIVSVQKMMLDHAPAEIRYRHLPTLVDGSKLQKIFAFAAALWQLRRQLSRKEADLLHVHMSEWGSAFRQATIAAVALFFRTPVVIHAHGPEFHLFYAKLPALLQHILSWVFRNCSQFIVLSESWRTYYIKHLNLLEERVTVLPNAVKIPQQIPDRLDRSIPTVLFLGRIGQRKGSFDLVQAFAKLTSEARLVMAGDGEGEALRGLVQELGSTNIQIIDWVDPAQRDVLLSEADAFVLPSYNEGLPMSILEAMSWGLPIIATPVGGIPEVVTSENGRLIKPGNIEQLAEAMQLLIDNEKLRLELGKNARKSVAVFDVEHYMAMLTKIYESILAAQPK